MFGGVSRLWTRLYVYLSLIIVGTKNVECSLEDADAGRLAAHLGYQCPSFELGLSLMGLVLQVGQGGGGDQCSSF